MADDETLSKKIIKSAEALQKWEEMRPLVAPVKSLVDEYGDVIDGIGQFFGVVGFVWDIYSGMEKAKDDAAQQQAMVQQITKAVDGMISRATIELKHHFDEKEVDEAVMAVDAIQQGFREDVLPYAKTFPLTGFDLAPLDNWIKEARMVIVKLHTLIDKRAKVGDGAAIIVLYRNLHAVVQCQLTMNKWRWGVTQAVIESAEREMTRLIQVWVPVVRGLQLMSDKSFSPGIIEFHAGGNGRPEFWKYSYHYMGKQQPVHGSKMAPVSQAFIEARKTARENAIPKGVMEWNNHPYQVMKQLRELKKTVVI